MADNGAAKKRVSKQMKLVWESDEGKRAKFANHATIVSDGSSYILRFYQVLAPPVGIDEDTETVIGRHVVTLAISNNDMKAIAILLEENVGISPE